MSAKILYKFKAIDKFAFDILLRKRVYLSDWGELNDPHEAQMLIPDPVNQGFQFHANPRRLSKLSNNTLPIENAEARICCFSQRWHRNLMWSHYADGHKGMAIGIELPESKGEFELIDVVYDDLVPRLEAPITRDSVKQALSHKSSEWHYEEEVRVLSFDPDARFVEGIRIHEIIFGSRASREDKELVMRALNQANTPVFKTCDKPGHYLLNKTDIRHEFGV